MGRRSGPNHGVVMPTDRATQLKAMLAARTSRDGSPLKGYAKNVQAIRDELDRLAPLRRGETVSAPAASGLPYSTEPKPIDPPLAPDTAPA
jgi:hypothetical protein